MQPNSTCGAQSSRNKHLKNSSTTSLFRNHDLAKTIDRPPEQLHMDLFSLWSSKHSDHSWTTNELTELADAPAEWRRTPSAVIWLSWVDAFLPTRLIFDCFIFTINCELKANIERAFLCWRIQKMQTSVCTVMQLVWLKENSSYMKLLTTRSVHHLTQ